MKKTLAKILALTIGITSILAMTACGDVKYNYKKTDDLYQVSKELSDKNASENTQRLYSFLCDIYGEKVLSGQVCDKGMNGPEMEVIRETTGKTPAILSMDFMDDSPGHVTNMEGKTTEYGIEWWEQGGILEYHWHWRTYDEYTKPGEQWYGTFYTKSTTFNLKNALSGKDNKGNAMLLKGIETIAAQIKILADKDIPILFRPLHEASGGWFWWGASGPEAYIELYKLIYDQLTNYYGLHNIIWIWNGQDAKWYPGDEYVDIVSYDSYPGKRVYTSQKKLFNQTQKVPSQNKMVYMSENGCVFRPDDAAKDSALWGCFITWQGEFIQKTVVGAPSLSEEYNEKDVLKEVYNSDRVLTLDELPDISKYSKK